MLKDLLKIWVGSKLPDVHIYPQNNEMANKIFVKRFIIHPIKRRLAKYYLIFLRQFFKIKVIGITGSAGKTTTKEMLASILGKTSKVVSSYKNIDPVYNIPDTILRCRPSTKYLLLEMGVEYPGEMEFYLWLAKPDISVITNIGPTHLEYFLNIEGVLKEKKIIATSLDSAGCVILNNNDPYLSKIKKEIKAKLVLFGKGTEIYSSDVKITKSGTEFSLALRGQQIDVALPLAGDHFVNDALAAVSAALTAETTTADIKKGLNNYNIPEHRMNIFTEKGGSLIIDDTYNNNPKAAKEALKVFYKLSENRNRGIVFGSMLELGKQSEYYHRMIGKMIALLKIDFLICMGADSAWLMEEFKKSYIGNNKPDTYIAHSTKTVYAILKKYLGKNTAVLLKGSRAMALDDIVGKLSK